MTLGERIKKVRKEFDLTQQEFGRRINMKQNTIALIEGGRNTSPQTISAICREFNVSETWLRTGDGEMFIQQSKEDELSAAVHRLLSGESSEFKTRLIKILADLGPREWDILESYALKLVQDRPTPSLTAEQKIDQKVELYRQQLLSEEEQASQVSSARESDVG